MCAPFFAAASTAGSDDTTCAAVNAQGVRNLAGAIAELERRLGDGPWALGATFSVVDCYLLVMYLWTTDERISRVPERPRWHALAQRIAAREAVKPRGVGGAPGPRLPDALPRLHPMSHCPQTLEIAMPLVYAGICCHAPGITSRPESAPPELRHPLHAAYARQRQAIIDAVAEALVVVSSEHFANFFMDNMPGFSIGMAEHYEGPIEDPDWLKIDRASVPANRDLSLRLIREVMQQVDLGFARSGSSITAWRCRCTFSHPTMTCPLCR